MAQPLKVVLFLGTCREGRVGLRVAKYMKGFLERTNHTVTFLDPLELDLPILKRPLHFYKDRSQAPSKLVEINTQIKESDAVIVVSAEYNHSIPPALSNLLDHFPGSTFAWKPAGIVCYSPGMFGGVRAAMQLRAMLGELGSVTVSNIFALPKVHESLDEEGNPLNDHVEKGAKALMTQLDWHATAMRNHRNSVGTP